MVLVEIHKSSKYCAYPLCGIYVVEATAELFFCVMYTISYFKCCRNMIWSYFTTGSQDWTPMKEIDSEADPLTG